MRFERQSVASEIPTSSMADIAFLLIIYFMITTTFAATRGLDFSLPEEDETDLIEPVESVLVEILPGGGLVVGSRPMQLAELLGYLAPKLAANPDKPVILKPSPDAEYGWMVNVLDELRQGKSRLGLAKDIQVAVPTARDLAGFWY